MATVRGDTMRRGRADARSTHEEETGAFAGVLKNVGGTERLLSALGGGALALYGLKRGGLSGAAMAVAGGSMIYRGASGHCELYKALGINRTERSGQASLGPGEGIRVEERITIDRPRAEVYAFWRDFENLPRFMSHLESVAITGDKTSHWVAKGPAGLKVEWDAEIVNDIPNEIIGWRSLEGAEVDHAGSVHFAEVADGRGTDIRVTMRYSPPAGRLGVTIASLFGEDAETQIKEDLRRFKQIFETGNAGTSVGERPGSVI